MATYKDFKNFRCVAKTYTETAYYGKTIWTTAYSKAYSPSAVKTIRGSPFWETCGWGCKSNSWRKIYKLKPVKK